MIPTIAFSPFLGGESVPQEVKIGLGLLLTIVLFPAVSERITEVPTGPLPFILTLAKEVFRLVVVQHTLKGLGDLARGFRANRALWRDDTWRPMDPAEVPVAPLPPAGGRP